MERKTLIFKKENHEQMARILHVPEDYKPVCFLPVGIAKEAAWGPAKQAFSERTWLNGFGNEEEDR